MQDLFFRKGELIVCRKLYPIKGFLAVHPIWALKIVSHFRGVRLKILLRLYGGAGDDEGGEFSVVKVGYVWFSFFSE